MITSIEALTITQSGTLNGHDVTIGALTIDANNVSLENLQVEGNVTLTNNVTTTFNVTNVKMTELITAQNEQRAVSAVADTKLKITFANSEVAYIQIRQDNVYIVVLGTTYVTSISVQADEAVIESPNNVLPNVKVDQGVTKIELNASIASVEIISNDEVEVTGKGNFETVSIATDQQVTLNTTGTIQTLNTIKTNVTLGQQVTVAETQLNGEAVLPEQVIVNIDEVKENVNTVIPEDEKVDYFVAKLMPVEEKYGFTTLALQNVNGATIQYEQVQRFSQPAADGAQVPTTAKTYHEGDAFIKWLEKDLIVYKVDDQGRIIESVKIPAYNTTPGVSSIRSTLEGNTLTIQSIQSEQLELAFLFGVSSNTSMVIDESRKLTLDENGVPTIKITLDEALSESDDAVQEFHYTVRNSENMSTHSTYTYFGNMSHMIAQNLHSLKAFTNTFTPSEWATSPMSYDYRAELIISRFVLVDKYPTVKRYKFVRDAVLEAVKEKDITVFENETDNEQAAGEISVFMKQVIDAQANTVAQFEAVEKAIAALQKENPEQYWEHESLIDTITLADIEAAEKMVQALPNVRDKQDFEKTIEVLKFYYSILEGNRTVSFSSTPITHEVQQLPIIAANTSYTTETALNYFETMPSASVVTYIK